MDKPDPHDQLFALLLDKDTITWQNLLRDLIRSENMDPWDIDVTIVSRRYIQMLKKLKDMDFVVSGKVVLAAAILLKLKSARLIGEDLAELDNLMSPQEDEETFYGELEGQMQQTDSGQDKEEITPLIPRTPQPRKRKVSIYDLIGALHKALEVKERRHLRLPPHTELEVPERKVDMGKLITSLYDRIAEELTDRERIRFSELLPSDDRMAKVLMLIPLLHLAHIDHRRINLLQEQQFGEISVELNKMKDIKNA